MEVIKDFNFFPLIHGAQHTDTPAAERLSVKRIRYILDRVLQMFISRLQQHYLHTPICGNMVRGIFSQKKKKIHILQYIPVAGKQ